MQAVPAWAPDPLVQPSHTGVVRHLGCGRDLDRVLQLVGQPGRVCPDAIDAIDFDLHVPHANPGSDESQLTGADGPRDPKLDKDDEIARFQFSDQAAHDRREPTRLGQPPVVSPDGQWVAFWAKETLKKVPLAGGPVVEVASGIAWPPFGLSWDGRGS